MTLESNLRARARNSGCSVEEVEIAPSALIRASGVGVLGEMREAITSRRDVVSVPLLLSITSSNPGNETFVRSRAVTKTFASSPSAPVRYCRKPDSMFGLMDQRSGLKIGPLVSGRVPHHIFG